MEYPMGKQEFARLMRMAKSSEGKALIQKLSESKSKEINDAVTVGDAEQLKQLILDFMSTDEARALKKKMEASNG